MTALQLTLVCIAAAVQHATASIKICVQVFEPFSGCSGAMMAESCATYDGVCSETYTSGFGSSCTADCVNNWGDASGCQAFCSDGPNTCASLDFNAVQFTCTDEGLSAPELAGIIIVSVVIACICFGVYRCCCRGSRSSAYVTVNQQQSTTVVSPVAPPAQNINNIQMHMTAPAAPYPHMPQPQHHPAYPSAPPSYAPASVAPMQYPPAGGMRQC